MRINIYRHEVEQLAAFGTNVVSDEQDDGIIYYGIRFYTSAPFEDVDESAFTLWVPVSDDGSPVVSGLRSIADQIRSACDLIKEDEACLSES